MAIRQPDLIANNECILVIKRGDQGKHDARDWEVLSVLDPQEAGWTDGMVISDHMATVFAMVTVPRDKKDFLRNKIEWNSVWKEQKKESRYCIDDSKLSKAYKNATIAKGVVVEIQDGKAFAIDESWVKKKDFVGLPLVTDNNAWSGGTATIGSGKTYTLFTLACADLNNGGMTSNAIFRLETAITEAGACSMSQNMGTYNLRLTSDLPCGGDITTGRKITYTGTASLFPMAFTICPMIEIDSLLINVTGNMDYNAVFYVTNLAGFTGYDYIHDNMVYYTGGGTGCGFSLYDTSPQHRIVGNIVSGAAGTIGVGYRILVADSGDIVENNVAIACKTGFDCFNQAHNMVNNFAFTCSTIGFANKGSLTTDSKNASTDTSGSEAGLRSLTVADQVESSTIGDGATYCQPKTTGALGNGVAPTYMTTYINGVAVGTPVYIGAKGPVAAGTGVQLGFFKSANFQSAFKSGFWK